MEIMVGILIVLMLITLTMQVWYNRADGEMLIEQHEDGVRRFSLELDNGPEHLAAKKVVRFRVIKK